MIANMIQSAVMEASLVTEQVSKKSEQLQKMLIFSLVIYYILYVVLSCLVGSSHNVQVFISTFSAANSVFTLLAMSIYWYTIKMLRVSIEKCISYQFDTKGVYSIYALYCFLFGVQMAYLFSYQYVPNAIIVSTMIHLINYFAVQLIVFLMLIRTGCGLKIHSHQLNNGAMQYEGYDHNNKHLFTFTVGDNELKFSTTSPTGDDSDSSEDNESQSNLDKTFNSNYDTNLFIEGYEAGEELLRINQRVQQSILQSRSNSQRPQSFQLHTSSEYGKGLRDSEVSSKSKNKSKNRITVSGSSHISSQQFKPGALTSMLSGSSSNRVCSVGNNNLPEIRETDTHESISDTGIIFVNTNNISGRNTRNTITFSGPNKVPSALALVSEEQAESNKNSQLTLNDSGRDGTTSFDDNGSDENGTSEFMQFGNGDGSSSN